VRIFLAAALALSVAACKKSSTEEVPGWTVAPPPKATTPPPVEAPPAVPAPPAEAPPDRKTPPTDAELKAALKPMFPRIGECIARAVPPASVKELDLRFVIQPTGKVSEVKLFDLDDATRCLQDAFEKMTFAPWAGSGTILNLTVQRSGEPVWLPTPSDGGR
jgi:hypothetical protein